MIVKLHLKCLLYFIIDLLLLLVLSLQMGILLLFHLMHLLGLVFPNLVSLQLLMQPYHLVLSCIVYAVPWCQAVDEWKVEPTINNLADGKHIGASALQGRMVYTDVVTNALAVEVKTRGTASL